MRQFKSDGKISVNVIAGTHTVILGMDADKEAAKGLLGFAIQREDHTAKTKIFLRNLLSFEELDHGGDQHSAFENPIQAFQWSDFSATPSHEYTYTVTPVYGKPTFLDHRDPLEVKIATESETDKIHRIFFNRGVAGSQAFDREFPQLAAMSDGGRKDALNKAAEARSKAKPPKSEADDALSWLTRGLESAIIDFIGEAKGKGFALRGCLYEFAYQRVLLALKAAQARCKDVKVVVDYHGDDIRKENDPAIKKAGVESFVIQRDGIGQGISHNKFIVLLKSGKPVAVWGGSTNISVGGIFGQSNVGHAVWDADVAATYLKYWDEISTNPPHSKAEDGKGPFNKFNDTLTPVDCKAGFPKGVSVIFSPRSDAKTLDSLQCYARMMDNAKSGVFLTEAFGVSSEFKDVLVKPKKYLRYILMDNTGQAGNRQNYVAVSKIPLNRIALGEVIAGHPLAQWHEEHLTGVNVHVKFVHTKYMLIDPLGDDPIVISGSANFSKASTINNDENMMVIRGDTRVADIYLSEFMRLFTHFEFRDRVANAAKNKGASAAPRKIYLTPDDSWTKRFYKAGSVEEKERQFFAGTAK